MEWRCSISADDKVRHCPSNAQQRPEMEALRGWMTMQRSCKRQRHHPKGPESRGLISALFTRYESRHRLSNIGAQLRKRAVKLDLWQGGNAIMLSTKVVAPLTETGIWPHRACLDAARIYRDYHIRKKHRCCKIFTDNHLRSPSCSLPFPRQKAWHSRTAGAGSETRNN